MTKAELRERYAHLAKPAAHLRPAATSAFTQLGGIPRLPEDFVWPLYKGSPHAFLGQIDLAELRGSLSSFLPATGVLSFFYDEEQRAWGFDPDDRGGWLVHFHDGDLAALKSWTHRQDIPAYCFSKRKAVAPHRIETMPYFRAVLDTIPDWDRDGEAYLELVRDVFAGLPQHQVLGHPDPVQEDTMERTCQLASNGIYLGNPSGFKDRRRADLESAAGDWKLLLQLDSDAELDWLWGSGGKLYFWIREMDAKARDFSRVWLELQST